MQKCPMCNNEMLRPTLNQYGMGVVRYFWVVCKLMIVMFVFKTVIYVAAGNTTAQPIYYYLVLLV